MESSSISFSDPKYAIKIYIPMFKGLGAKLGLGEKIRVPATLYTRVNIPPIILMLNQNMPELSRAKLSRQ